jgi:hypothetical protein
MASIQADAILTEKSLRPLEVSGCSFFCFNGKDTLSAGWHRFRQCYPSML